MHLHISISTTYKGTNLTGKLDLNRLKTLIKRSRCICSPHPSLAGSPPPAVCFQEKKSLSRFPLDLCPAASPRAAVDRRCCLTHATAPSMRSRLSDARAAVLLPKAFCCLRDSGGGKSSSSPAFFSSSKFWDYWRDGWFGALGYWIAT
jgi:hypothetical protein